LTAGLNPGAWFPWTNRSAVSPRGVIENESGVTTRAQIAALERRESDDLIGISLEEAKSMTVNVRRALVEGDPADQTTLHTSAEYPRWRLHCRQDKQGAG
jgi:ABC-type Zn uptake system ZnuABC Zn-binding protein ZnuA